MARLSERRCTCQLTRGHARQFASAWPRRPRLHVPRRPRHGADQVLPIAPDGPHTHTHHRSAARGLCTCCARQRCPSATSEDVPSSSRACCLHFLRVSFVPPTWRHAVRACRYSVFLNASPLLSVALFVLHPIAKRSRFVSAPGVAQQSRSFSSAALRNRCNGIDAFLVRCAMEWLFLLLHSATAQRSCFLLLRCATESTHFYSVAQCSEVRILLRCAAGGGCCPMRIGGRYVVQVQCATSFGTG